MTIRVQHHAHVRLGLVFGRSCTELMSPRNAGVEVVDRDVEMHHQLAAGRARPLRPLIVVLMVEREARST
jgi:hypothetical protein